MRKKSNKTKKPTAVVMQRVVRRRKRVYYSLHWRIKNSEHGCSGTMVGTAAHALVVLGLGADVVMITRCEMESAS